MAESDIGDIVLVVSDFTRIRTFLKEIVGLEEDLAAPADQQIFKLSNGKKIWVFIEAIGLANIRKHSVEIRVDNLDEVRSNLVNFYATRTPTAMEQDGIFVSFNSAGDTAIAIAMDTGVSRIRVARL
jgi:hypothetical protein